MKKLIVLLTILVFMLFTGCDIIEPENKENVSRVEFSFNDLKQLPDTLTYVIWNTYKDRSADGFVEMFSVDAGGSAKVVADKKLVLIHDMVSFYVTVEETADFDSSSAKGTEVLSGVMFGNETSLSADNSIGIFGAEESYYTIYTPSDDVTDNDSKGIWFADSVTSTNGPVAGLKLPPQNSDYVYEAFLELNGVKFSIGEFSMVNGPDSDNQYSGTEPVSFPGEDLLLNAPSGLTFPADVYGGKITVIVKALGDAGNSIRYTLLEATVANGAETNKSHKLNVVPAQFPSGSSSIVVEL